MRGIQRRRGFAGLGRRAARIAAGASVICALTAGGATAASWVVQGEVGADQTVDYPRSVSQPQVAVDAAGDAVAVWQGAGSSGPVIQAATRSAGGPWQTLVDLSVRYGSDPQVAMNPAGDAVAVWTRDDESGHEVVQAAVRPAGGTWQPAVDLSGMACDGEKPQVALDQTGRALVAWRCYQSARYVVQTAARPGTGGTWQAPVDISAQAVAGGELDEPRLAVDRAGDAVVVWQEYAAPRLIVRAAARTAAGAWRAPVVLTGAAGGFDPEVAIDPAGNAAAVWQVNHGTSVLDSVQAAALPAGRTWQPPVDLTAPDQNASHPHVAFAAGVALAVWQQAVGGAIVIESSSRSTTAAWGAPVTLSTPGANASEPRVAVVPGAAVATWSGAGTVQAATLAGRGPWQPPVTLSAADLPAGEPRVILDAAGDATAVWVRGYGRLVQAATHPAGGAWMSPLNLTTPGGLDVSEVPEVGGMAKRAAASQISAAGLRPSLTGATTAPISYVAGETPAPGTILLRTSTVTLFLKPGTPP